jgi:hypothetical protein
VTLFPYTTLFRSLVRLVTERCLELKERASGAHLARADLVQAVDAVEKLLFRVTLR